MYRGFAIQEYPSNLPDREEACEVCLTKSANANYPCVKCLVHQTDLDKIDKQFPLFTLANMHAVSMESLTKSTPTVANDFCKEHGIQGTEVCDYHIPPTHLY